MKKIEEALEATKVPFDETLTEVIGITKEPKKGSPDHVKLLKAKAKFEKLVDFYVQETLDQKTFIDEEIHNFLGNEEDDETCQACALLHAIASYNEDRKILKTLNTIADNLGLQ